MDEAKVLFVDDDPNILHAYQRQMKKHFRVSTALGGMKGLEYLQRDEFAVVVADMRMPSMDGIEFLSVVRKQHPNIVRMMLTGYASLKTAIQAVNEGNIFRFLTKPCPPDMMMTALLAGLEQYRLITSEKELLEKTLKGSVRVLIETMTMAAPEAFGQAIRLREVLRKVAGIMDISSTWDLELGAMMSHIGFISIPSELRIKYFTGRELTDDEKDMIEKVPEIGRKLLMHIPRLESVRNIVYYQSKYFDGSGFPSDNVGGWDIPLGSRLIRFFSDYFKITSEGADRDSALSSMKARDHLYDPEIFNIAEQALSTRDPITDEDDSTTLEVEWKELFIGDLLQSSLVTTDGRLLLAAGQRVTRTLLLLVSNYERLVGIRGPIRIVRSSRANADFFEN